VPRGNKKTKASRASALALAAKRAEAKARAQGVESDAKDENPGTCCADCLRSLIRLVVCPAGPDLPHQQ
jgi:hypothetical protein